MNLRLLLVFALAAGACSGAPLTATTAVQTRPDSNAPVIGFLKAGMEPESAGEAPEGWMAVRLPGPFTAYVAVDAITKGLAVKDGTPLYAGPRSDATVLATSSRGDKIEITGLSGRWAQVKIDQPIAGYIHPEPLPATAAPAPGLTDIPAGASAPTAPAGAPNSEPGRPADTPALPGPQLFQGRFASTHHWIGPTRPYDWQLLDAGGSRIAYLNVTKLLLTEQLDKYVGHQVAVYGAVQSIPDSRDLVLTVESLQLK